MDVLQVFGKCRFISRNPCGPAPIEGVGGLEVQVAVEGSSNNVVDDTLALLKLTLSNDVAAMAMEEERSLCR